jgi:hypothetical protein
MHMLVTCFMLERVGLKKVQDSQYCCHVPLCYRLKPNVDVVSFNIYDLVRTKHQTYGDVTHHLIRHPFTTYVLINVVWQEFWRTTILSAWWLPYVSKLPCFAPLSKVLCNLRNILIKLLPIGCMRGLSTKSGQHG